jgi:hypothetical protein
VTQVNEHEKPEADLADDVKLEPSTAFPGWSAAVAFKDGMHVCWNCFDPLGDHHDLRMGETIIRVCRKAECVSSVHATNRARALAEKKIILI